ncbi:MAG TPA: RES family NAD+ phosphorylase [Candidatus Polarisedimenticolaceae bacterium]|nr:RES family NAD+ phosphorylase [Candidatus Polarisedimenticolaceae bacterium]
MRLWRLCRSRYSAEALNGEGGLGASGRWHLKGTRIVYASQTLSLAALEYLVHVARDLAPPDLISVEIDVAPPVKIERLAPSDLPDGWNAMPAPAAAQRLGTAWIARGESTVLEVPSALIPHEHNYLLNPARSDFAKVTVVKRRRFSFDPRLLG